MQANVRDRVVFASPKAKRNASMWPEHACVNSASSFRPWPMVFDYRVESAYTGWPDRLYLIGTGGRVLYKSKGGLGAVEIPCARDPQDAKGLRGNTIPTRGLAVFEFDQGKGQRPAGRGYSRISRPAGRRWCDQLLRHTLMIEIGRAHV